MNDRFECPHCGALCEKDDTYCKKCLEKLTADDIHIFAYIDDSTLTAGRLSAYPIIEDIRITLPEDCDAFVYQVGDYELYANGSK